MDSEDCPGLGGRPEDEGAVDSEMTHLVPEDGQQVEASGSSAKGRGNSSSGSAGVLTVDGPVVIRTKLSEPYFLFKRVLTERILKEELGKNGGKLIVMAVHAVMQESGFVALDPPATGMPAADRLCRNPVSLRYSLPELVARSQGLNMPESVTLTFQSPGHFITVYGSLANANLGLPSVLAGLPRVCCLDMRSFAPAVELMRMWAKGDDNNDMEADDNGGFWSSYPVKRMFEFWRIVKDYLALPLLLDLTESVGLSLPSYFTYVPTELKLKIFESLSGIDLARVGCVCSELRYLTSSNDLWKQKYMDEFKKKTTESQGMIDWKQRFARSWKKRRGGYSDSHRRHLRRRTRRADREAQR
ncbi:putative F-box protein At1g23770 [Syzygium oleosum]|uniref:putative F-box protein At1g23770 n=1 Tax=Syzygium oleosum TaxID=219896 RepID=UPI0024BBB30A|nr:putative F-box protein At1g23770 [Syzygium oleosum]